jgi:hypothetical protein
MTLPWPGRPADDVLTGMQLKRAHIEEIRSAAIREVGTATESAGDVCRHGLAPCRPRGGDVQSRAANFPLGSTVTLTVAPVTGSQFNGWSGACLARGPASSR